MVHAARMKTALIGILTLVSLLSLAQNRPMEVEQVAIQSSKYWLDVDYVGDGIIGHRLDIHLPLTGPGPFPVVICIYGSAWRSNASKANAFKDRIGQRLLKEGYAVVAINHRSSGDAKFPAQIQDVKAAIRYVRANAARFGLNAASIGITGWSSGGHLATFAGVTNGLTKTTVSGIEVDVEGSLGPHVGTSSRVDAVVDWFGPTDFLIMDRCGSSFSHDDANSPESMLVGGPIQANKDRCAVANPISYVRKETPPFLIIHGDKDPLVPFCQSEKLYEKMQQMGVPSRLVIVPGGEHGPGVMIDSYFDQAMAFFRETLRK